MSVGNVRFFLQGAEKSFFEVDIIESLSTWSLASFMHMVKWVELCLRWLELRQSEGWIPEFENSKLENISSSEPTLSAQLFKF